MAEGYLESSTAFQSSRWLYITYCNTECKVGATEILSYIPILIGSLSSAGNYPTFKMTLKLWPYLGMKYDLWKFVPEATALPQWEALHQDHLEQP